MVSDLFNQTPSMYGLMPGAPSSANSRSPAHTSNQHFLLPPVRPGAPARAVQFLASPASLCALRAVHCTSAARTDQPPLVACQSRPRARDQTSTNTAGADRLDDYFWY